MSKLNAHIKTINYEANTSQEMRVDNLKALTLDTEAINRPHNSQLINVYAFGDDDTQGVNIMIELSRNEAAELIKQIQAALDGERPA